MTLMGRKRQAGFRRQGATLALVMIVVVIAGTMASMFLASQSSSVGIARNVSNHSQARYIAESGAVLAVGYIQQNDTWRDEMPNGTWASKVSFAGGTYTLTCEDGEDTDGDGAVNGDGDLTDDNTDVATLKCTGTYEGSTHTVTVVARPKLGSSTRVLFVVADDSSLTAQEDAKKTLMEAWGFEVSTISDSGSSSAYQTAMLANDVAYVSAEASAGSVGTKLRAASIGVVNELQALCDEMGFSGNGSGFSAASIDIVDNTHYICSSFSAGELTILSSSSSLSVVGSSLASGASVLAERPSSSTGSLVTIEAGGTLSGSGTADGRRVQLPWGGSTFAFSSLNGDGKRIMKRAIEWAAATPSSSVPIARWNFEEISGTKADDSIGNHDGTYKNSMTLGQEGIGETNAASFAYDTNNHVLVPHSDDFLLDNGTVTFWFNSNKLNGHRGLFSKDSSNYDTGGHIHIYTESTRLRARFQSTNSTVTLESSSGLSLDTWYHVAFRFGSGGAALYLNGVQIDSDSYTGGMGTTSGGIGNYEPLVFGANTWSSGDLTEQNLRDYFGGKMDDIRIYDKALAGAELLTMYLQGVPEEEAADATLVALYEFVEVPPPSPVLVAHWPLDDKGSSSTPGMALKSRVDFGGNKAVIDSYDSSLGKYGVGNSGSEAVVTVNEIGSNKITLWQNGILKGDAYIGPGGDVTKGIQTWSGSSITGKKDTLSAQITMPVLSAPTGSPFDDPHSGHYTVGGGQVRLIDQDGHFNSIQMWSDGKIQVSGHVTVLLERNLEVTANNALEILPNSSLTLYVKNTLDIGGLVNANTGDPSKLRIYMIGDTKHVDLWGSGELHAVVQNPKGDLNVWSTSQFYGAYIGRKLLGGSGVHIDTNVAGGSSTVVDEAVGDIDGTLVNDPTALVSGAVGTAIEFDGSNDYIEIPHDSSQMLNSGAVSFWFKTDEVGHRQGIFSKDSSNYDTGGHLTIYTESSRLKVRLQSTGASYSLQSGSIMNDTWYHVLLDFGSGGMKLYLDGSEVDSDSYSGGLGTSSGGLGNEEPIVLGANSWGSGDKVSTPLADYFSGVIDDVRIYNYPLDATQVANLYAGKEIGPSTGPGTIVYDTSNYKTPLNLTIGDPSRVTWIEGGGLTFDDSTIAISSGAASKLYTSLTGTDEMTLEVKFTPANLTQNGPARIVSFSSGTSNRNFTFGQTDQKYVQRLRTSSTGSNGTPDISSGSVLSTTDLQHVVVTHNGDDVKMYRNGTLEVTTSRSGTYNWNSAYSFALANETSQDRAWLGTLYRVAVYDRALNSTQVNELYGGSTPDGGAVTGYEFEWDE